MFVENLPGYPDNIRLSSTGGYWVAMSMVFTEFDDMLTYSYPRARNFLAKARIKLCINIKHSFTCLPRTTFAHGLLNKIKFSLEEHKSLALAFMSLHFTCTKASTAG